MSLRRLLVVSGIYLIMAVYSFRPCLASTVGEMTGITGFNVACDYYCTSGSQEIGTEEDIVRFTERNLRSQRVNVLTLDRFAHDVKAGLVVVQVRTYQASNVYWYSVIVECSGNAYVAANHDKRWLLTLSRFDNGGITDKKHLHEDIFHVIQLLVTTAAQRYKAQN